MSILKSYLKRLTNLSTRNRSLVLASLPAEQFIDFHELDHLNGRSSFELIGQLIGQKNEIKLCDVIDPRHQRTNEISKKLKKIARTQRFIAQECGSEDLFVGWPFVQGKLLDGTPIHGPLLFFPVSLDQENNRWLLKKRDTPITFNRSLLLAYAHFNQTKITDDFIETNISELDRDPLIFRTQLYELLKVSALAINFNVDTFADLLRPFTILKTTDLELLEQNGELKLQPEAVLGVFPQAGSYLMPDYTALIEADYQLDFAPNIPENPRVNSKEEHIVTAFPLDASQEKALRAVKLGQSLVVQGPPGTGKSQLIANLITDFAAQGKRVLLVCQKRVALDIVYDRLKSVGMAYSVALIHDFKSDRAALYAQLAHQIGQVEDYKRQNYSLDTVFLERTFTQESRQIDQIVAELDAFKAALFDTQKCGLAIKELYLTSNQRAPLIDLSEQYRHFVFDQKLGVFTGKLRDYQQYLTQLKEPHPWGVRTSFAQRNYENIADIKEVIDNVVELKPRLAALAQPPTLIGLRSILSEIQHLDTVIENLKDAPTTVLFGKMLFEKYAFPQTAEKRNEELQKIQKYVLDESLETTLPDDVLVVYLGYVKNAVLAQSSAVKKLAWLFSDARKKVNQLLAVNNLANHAGGLEVLERRINNRIEFQKLVGANLYDSLRVGAKNLQIAAIEAEFSRINQAEKAATAAAGLTLLAVRPFAQTDAPRLGFELKERQTYWKKVADQEPKWRTYLSDFQVDTILKDDTGQYAVRLKNTLKADFDLLVEADKMLESFSDQETQIVGQLVQKGGDLETVFLNSLKLAWITHIEACEPLLRGVSSLKISQLEERLQAGIIKKQALSQAVLLMKLRQNTYQDLLFNRLNNLLTYRELNHQVTKKKKIWPVRKLLDSYAEDIFRLIPCWMASPESVSAIFPLQKDLFDLVIFDEASQCFVENAVPSMYRGKQVLITGDSKQLVPNDLYRIRFEDDTDADPQLETDSLLDLAAQVLPQTVLRSHYRSRSLALIAFSNQYFYKNQLQTLPHFGAINETRPPIEFIKTEGVWHNNANQIEAERVVLLVAALQAEAPEQSIGVVTFNFPQQKLIEDLLADETVFVKNIENVQGDERDIIVFSVGYAPDLHGKMTMNFGTLNAHGGENRLNVAVTRAKSRVVVVASIMPHQLKTDNAQNDGPKLLKRYLEYAIEVSEGRFKPLILVREGYESGLLLRDKLIDSQFIDIDLGQTKCTDLPFADLTIRQGELYESLVLTDDDLYYQSQTAKEPHGYLPIALKAKNWLFRRIYSRQFWANS